MTEFSTTATESLYQYIRDSTPLIRRFFAVAACDRETRRGRVIMQLNRLPLLAQTSLMRKHLHAYKPISVGLFVTHSGHGEDIIRSWANSEGGNRKDERLGSFVQLTARRVMPAHIHSENASTSGYEFGPGRGLLGLSFGHPVEFIRQGIQSYKSSRRLFLAWIVGRIDICYYTRSLRVDLNNSLACGPRIVVRLCRQINVTARAIRLPLLSVKLVPDSERSLAR
jgi:hypothetical protein